MTKRNLFTVFFEMVNEDTGHVGRWAHPYSFVSREAAQRFVAYEDAHYGADGYRIVPSIPEAPVARPAAWPVLSSEDIPF